MKVAKSIPGSRVPSAQWTQPHKTTAPLRRGSEPAHSAPWCGHWARPRAPACVLGIRPAHFSFFLFFQLKNPVQVTDNIVLAAGVPPRDRTSLCLAQGSPEKSSARSGITYRHYPVSDYILHADPPIPGTVSAPSHLRHSVPSPAPPLRQPSSVLCTRELVSVSFTRFVF